MPSTALPATAQTRNVTDGNNLAAAGTAVDSANGNNFPNDGNTLLRVKTTDGTPKTVTVKYLQQTVDGVTVTPVGKVYTVPATTGDRLIGPFPVLLYGSTVEVTFNAGTSTTAYVYQPSS